MSHLLCIARITTELNCRVILYSYYCFFQDLATGKMIGNGSLKDGLYYLDSQPDTHGRLIQAYHTVRADDSAAKIWLWHQRLGHPSFLILQCLFPALFLQVSIKVIHLLFLFILMCEVLHEWFLYLLSVVCVFY
jgi:hypothetical protein